MKKTVLLTIFALGSFSSIKETFIEAHVMNTAVAQGIGFNQLYNAVRDVYSAEVWFTALPVMKFDEFTTKKTELGVQPGIQIMMPKMGNIKRGGTLKEGVRIQTQAMSQSQQPIRVRELGNGLAFSELLLQTSFYDQLAAASILLGRDLAITLDTVLRTSYLKSTNVIYANGKANRAALIAGDIMTTKEVKDAIEALETANSPRWGAAFWISFIHPHQGRGLRDDGDWVNASLYGATNQIFNGEIGRYEDCRFIVTTVMPNGRSSAKDPETNEYIDIGFDPTLENGFNGNQTTIYKAVFFGDWAVGHAVALPVELRDNGVQDFGREHALGWYSIWGEDILEDDNIIVVETA